MDKSFSANLSEVQGVSAHRPNGFTDHAASAMIAVLIPCLNEAVTIAKVVRDFRAALPTATIYVYDNCSTDQTRNAAMAAGAVVRYEAQLGKGNVVRRMFSDIEADVFVLVDGDDTYHALSAPSLIESLIEQQLDMVNGLRLEMGQESYRTGHRLGNRLFTAVIARIFGNRLSDVLSGYKVLSRRFVKSFPALTTGFEIEAEMVVHALQLRMPIAEVPTPYKDRPAGSSSKLRTIPDGIRILKAIFILIKEERPLSFFCSVATLLALTAILLAIPIFAEYLKTGLVPRFPTAILSTGLMVLASLSLACGLILDTVTLGRRELKRLCYLAVSAHNVRVPPTAAATGIGVVEIAEAQPAQAKRAALP